MKPNLAPARAKKSTTVRKATWTQRVLPPALGTLSQLSPSVAARVAERVFLTPPRFAAPKPEREFLGSAHRFFVREASGRKLHAWSWGSGPTIVCMHGWGGRGGQFHPFVLPLVEAGFSVVTFDAPGHGRTRGRYSSLVEFSRALRAVVSAVGPVHAVLGHSMGAAAAAVAIAEGSVIPRLVTIASPTNALDFLGLFGGQLRLTGETVRLLKQRVADRYGVPWEKLRMDAVIESLRHPVPLLVVHDRDDREVPVAKGLALAAAWPGAELMTTEKLGHHRVLRAPEVVHRTVRFLSESARAAG